MGFKVNTLRRSKVLLQPYRERWHNRLKVFTELTIALTFQFSFQIKALILRA